MRACVCSGGKTESAEAVRQLLADPALRARLRTLAEATESTALLGEALADPQFRAFRDAIVAATSRPPAPENGAPAAP